MLSAVTHLTREAAHVSLKSRDILRIKSSHDFASCYSSDLGEVTY